MSKVTSPNSHDSSLRTAAAARTYDARRLIQAASESIDNVARAAKVELITSEPEATAPQIGKRRRV